MAVASLLFPTLLLKMISWLIPHIPQEQYSEIKFKDRNNYCSISRLSGKEQFTALREVHKGGSVKDQTVNVGHVVLVHNNVPWSRWQLAVTEELFKLMKGLDELTRVTKSSTKTGRTDRPIARLYPLEVNSACETAATTDSDINDMQTSKDGTTGCPRASRITAIKTQECIKNWTKTLSVALEDVKDWLTLYNNYVTGSVKTKHNKDFSVYSVEIHLVNNCIIWKKIC